MGDSSKDIAKKDQVDEELSNLLDSALEDFTKTNPVKKNEKLEETGKEVEPSNGAVPEWSNDFIQQAAKQFEENFASLMAGSNPNITPQLLEKKLQQMADAAHHVLENPAEVCDASSDFSASISRAVQDLSAGAESLQAPLNEEDFMKMFTGGGSGQENDVLPFMQGMMQGLLSKEVLGPSLEDFVQKLPEYIENNKEKLDKKDVERYENQKKLMEEVLVELNEEKETDSNDVKKERFMKVLGLMQKLQDYGQPPSELVGDLETPFGFDPQGNPLNSENNPGSNSECNIM
nr:peroxisomal biogenesis factor 19 [Leptinotarsa decemlineata]